MTNPATLFPRPVPMERPSGTDRVSAWCVTVEGTVLAITLLPIILPSSCVFSTKQYAHRELAYRHYEQATAKQAEILGRCGT